MKQNQLEYSSRIYVKISKPNIAMFRFLLEAYENLGLMTVVDNRVAWLKISYALAQEQEILTFLASIKEQMNLELKTLPRLKLSLNT